MRTTFTLLFALFTFTAMAQQNFVPGHYTTLQGDRVDVFINDQNWQRNPIFIQVKQNMEHSATQQLNVTDIKGFVLSTGDVFEAFSVDIDKSPTKLSTIEVGSEPLIVKETVFLRAIVKGVINLYHLKDENLKEHYFISKEGEAPVELINRITKYQNGSVTGYMTHPIYRNTLTDQLTACTQGVKNMERVNFTKKSLQETITDYNKCVSGTEGEYVAASEKVKWSIGVTGGSTFSNLNIKSERKDLTDPDFKGANYTIGVALTTTLPRVRGKWAIKNELMFKPMKFDGAFEDVIHESNYSKGTITFDIAYLGLNTLVHYTLLDARLKSYLVAGVANNFIVADNSSQVVYKKFHTDESTKETEPIESIRKHEQALLIGIGAIYNKIGGEIRLENGNGFSPIESIKISKRTFAVQLSYTL